jgi:hypothetical protein
MFLDPKWRHGPQGSTYRLIFDVLLRCSKTIIFGHLPDGPKNRALSAKGKKVLHESSPAW